MPYQQLSIEESNKILEKRRRIKDHLGIDWYLATTIAKEIFGKKGIAVFRYQFTLNDPVDSKGYVIPMGALIGYDVGYARKGKRGASLHTTWQSSKGYAEAFGKLYLDYAEKNAKGLVKVEKVLTKYGIIG